MSTRVKIVVFFVVASLMILWSIFHPRPANSHADEIVKENGLVGSGVALKAPTSPVERSNELERIMMCESNGNPLAKNPNSSASGLYQWISSSWKHYGLELWGEDLYTKNVFSAKDNQELAEYVYYRYGSGDWSESKFCWSV